MKRTTRAFSIMLAVLMTVLLIPFGVRTANAEEEAPTIEKPVYITVTDEQDAALNGIFLQIMDSDGNVVQEVAPVKKTCTIFLPAGTYTVKISSVPEGYLLPDGEVTITVTLEQAEEKDDLTADTLFDTSHEEICGTHSSGHVGIERYSVKDEDGSVTAFCFNQDYDNPHDYSGYKRLVGTPELLFDMAQNKGSEITAQELYDHVLAAIYNSKAIQEEYGFDDTIMEFLVGRAIKNFTDPKKFISFDDDGNEMLIRDENGRPILDENGKYQYKPGGTIWGSVLVHAKRHGHNLMEEHPEYREAYYKLIGTTDHPDDYYLYIYYPQNWAPENTDTYQCLMSTFQVPPVRAMLKLVEATQIEITKVWEDHDNAKGIRPSAEEFAAMVKLLADGEDVTETYADNRTVTDNGDNTYTVSFDQLPKTIDEKEIAYTIEEKPSDGYTADQTVVENGGTITNTVKQEELIEITVNKIWDDSNNREGDRPDSITVNLLADGEKVQSAQITEGKNGKWTYTFKDLPKKTDDGKEITYTVTEERVKSYKTIVNGYTITNRYTPPTGDTTQFLLWTVLFVLSILAGVGILILERKNRNIA